MLYSELLPSPYIWNVDVCEMDWNEMEKKRMCLIFTSHQLRLSLQFHLALSLSPWRWWDDLNDKMSTIWNGIFTLPSVTVQDSVNNNHWNGQIIPMMETKWSSVEAVALAS